MATDTPLAGSRGSCPAVTLVLPRSRLRVWHGRLAEALRALGGQVGLAWAAEPETPPPGLDGLFALERTLRPRPDPRPSGWLARDALALPERGAGGVRLALPGAGEVGAGEVGGSDPVWHVLFDGRPGEAGLLQALLGGRAPLVEIAGRDGAVLARGRPSVEAAATLCEAYEAVVARVVPLVAMAVRTPQALPLPALERAPAAPPRALGQHAVRRLSRALVRRAYHLCFHAPHWRTGWRFTGSGPAVWDTGSLDGTPWRVLPDPGHRFYADPFLFAREGRTHVFVEDLDHRTGRGVISAVAFGPDGPTGPPVPVLEEAFHLSYPFVIAHGGEVWMIPETTGNRTVSLYRAAPYPHRWVRERDLLTGVVASDATVIHHGGRWWMFATLHDGEGAHSDALGLFMADALFGPWRAHPGNPVLIDAGAARPAGRMRVRDGRLWRPAQDCTQLYGGALALCEVTTLTDTGFEQAVRRRIGPGPAWPGRRLHTLNCGGGLEVIDGSALSPRLFRGIVGDLGHSRPD